MLIKTFEDAPLQPVTSGDTSASTKVHKLVAAAKFHQIQVDLGSLLAQEGVAFLAIVGGGGEALVVSGGQSLVMGIQLILIHLDNQLVN